MINSFFNDILLMTDFALPVLRNDEHRERRRSFIGQSSRIRCEHAFAF